MGDSQEGPGPAASPGLTTWRADPHAHL